MSDRRASDRNNQNYIFAFKVTFRQNMTLLQKYYEIAVNLCSTFQ